MIAFKLIAVAILSYLLGSLNFGVILSKYLKKEDVRESGSGNAGSTNMLRSYGKTMGILTILGDMLKVMVAIMIAKMIISPAEIAGFIDINGNENILIKSFAGFFSVLGHIFPCFFKFKGGKGVATSGGMVFMIDWRIALILLAVFILTVLLTKYVSLGSILMAVFYPVLIGIFYKNIVLIVIAVLFTVVVITAHRSNVKKLMSGTEAKITDKNTKK